MSETFDIALASARSEYTLLDARNIALEAERDAALLEVDRLRAELDACQNPEPTVWFGRNEGSPELDALLPTQSAIRVYKTDGNAPWGDVDGYLAQGRRVYLSVRNYDDAAWTAAAYNGVPNFILTVHHEPENDGITPEEFRAEQRRTFDIVAGRVPIAPALMAATFNKGEAELWIDETLPYAEIGVDGYLRKYPWQTAGFDAIFNSALIYAGQRALPLAICEVGVMQNYDGQPVPETLQAQEVDRLDDIVRDGGIHAVMYFHESWTKDGVTRDYRFLGRPQVEAAFRQMVGTA
jgi:hypothetical protein